MFSEVDKESKEKNEAVKKSIDQAYLDIDFRKKTIFLDKRGRDITNTVLTYQQSEWIVNDARNEPIP